MSQRRSSPCRLFSRAEDKLKLSDDVIEDEVTSTPDSRIWDLSSMRLEAAKVYSIGTDVCGVLGFATVSRSFARQLPNLFRREQSLQRRKIIYETNRNY
jgi:hypothetical protein